MFDKVGVQPNEIHARIADDRAGRVLGLKNPVYAIARNRFILVAA